MKALIVLLIFCFLSLPALGIEVSGEVYGTWSPTNNPYNVTGELSVPPDCTLIIEPGVEVIFQGHYKFKVLENAILTAIGTEQDSIFFIPNDESIGWHGVRFINSQYSTLQFCYFEYGKAEGGGDDENGGTIFSQNTHVEILNCTISNSRAEENGGAVYSRGSNCLLRDCLIINCNAVAGTNVEGGGGMAFENDSTSIIESNVISNNFSRDFGGGILIIYSSLTVRNNTFLNNHAQTSGGGIYCRFSDVQILDNDILYNSCCHSGSGWAQSGTGAGICSDYSDVLIEGNSIIGNTASTGSYLGYGIGGGIECRDSESVIINNLIDDNFSDGGSGVRCVDCDNVIIESNIISNNHADYGTSLYGVGGGGIWIHSSTGVLINGNVFIDNSIGLGEAGGGLHCYESVVSIFNNQFISNSSGGDGGGMSGEISDLYLKNNQFLSNSVDQWSSGRGGGIYVWNDVNLNVENCVFYDNHAIGSGGGIAFTLSDADSVAISNCTFSDNAGQGTAIALTGSEMLNCFISNSIIWNNASIVFYIQSGTVDIVYSDITGGYPGLGNMNADPLFVNPENGDFHLQSIVGSYHSGSWLPDEYHSPCIDAGNPVSRYDLEPEPNGGRINMGAYGNTEEASLSWIVAVEPSGLDIPVTFTLFQNHPNPFNFQTMISYSLPKNSHVELSIYDTAGRRVTKIADGWRNVGIHEVTFDGSSLASGVYIYKFYASEFEASGKMVLLK